MTLFQCLTDDCAVVTATEAVCPVCTQETVSAADLAAAEAEAEVEHAAYAYDHYLMYGDDDDATYNPHTGWSEYDYSDTGNGKFNALGEPLDCF